MLLLSPAISLDNPQTRSLEKSSDVNCVVALVWLYVSGMLSENDEVHNSFDFPSINTDPLKGGTCERRVCDSAAVADKCLLDHVQNIYRNKSAGHY